MAILGFGMDLDGRRLFPPVDEESALRSVQASLERSASDLRRQSIFNTKGRTFRGEMDRQVLDVGDPHKAGWTFAVASNDPRRTEIIEILKPLAVHRGMQDPSAPLLFGDEPADGWGEWVQDNYWAANLEGRKVPKYVLLVGSPRQLPFKLHSLMNTVADVGRLDFDSNADLDTYVQKIIRLEKAADPVVRREVLVFGTDGGASDPTYYSRRYMADPVVAHIRHTFGFDVTPLLAGEATKLAFEQAVNKGRPALVYTASHGLGLVGKSLAEQRRLNGAICCQTTGRLTLKDIFCADDVPADHPFLEGSIFFQFACFGAGTPAQSDFTHWLSGVPESYAEEDFVAALPKRLLAHPRGPVAFVGHLDTAWMHGFTDSESPNLLESWHNRMAPFVQAVNDILSLQPTAFAMQGMNDRYALLNSLLADTSDRQRRGVLKWTENLATRLLDTWITRGDAQNYMVLGDPAARLRISMD